MRGILGVVFLLISCLILPIFIFPKIASAHHVLINEVYYDVDASHGAEPANEWIELYNTTNQDVVIINWTIEDNSSSEEIPTSTIPPHGTLIIVAQESTYGFWSISGEKTFMNSSFGNGLANTGDRLVLKDETGTIHDQLSYGTDSTFSPALPDVEEGHSLEKIPAGSSFTDQPSPSPGVLTNSTPTSTPSPTVLPSNTPSPSKTPTPQPTLVTTSTPSQLTVTPKSSPTVTAKKSPTPTVVISQEILGLTNITPNPEISPTPKAEVQVKSLSFQNIALASTGILIILVSVLSSTFIFKRNGSKI